MSTDRRSRYQVAAHAASPVVVVRGRGAGGSERAAGQVVVGVDGSPVSALAIEFAFAHAALHGLGIIAIRAVGQSQRTPPADQPARIPEGQNSDDHESDLIPPAIAACIERYPAVPLHRKVARGQPAAVLVVESVGAALTVVGSRGRGGFTGLLSRCTSQTVLSQATGPVAVVPARSSRHRVTMRPPPRSAERVGPKVGDRPDRPVEGREAWRGAADLAAPGQPSLGEAPTERSRTTRSLGRCVVLSDREQQALHEIERQLLIEDPGFARAFDAETERIGRRPADVAWWAYTIMLVLSATFAVVSLMVGLPASTVVLVIVAALAWAARRRRHGPGSQPRDGS